MAAQPDFGELDRLTSVEELANLQAATEREAQLLDSEYAGRKMPDTVQEAWDAANALHSEIGERIANVNERKAKLAKMAGDPNKVEAPEVFIKPTHREVDIYDLDTIREPTVEKRNQVIRDNAQRAIEITRAPHDADLNTLSDFVDFNDSEDKEAARRILLTGAPAYRRAFNKYLNGQKDLWSPEEARAAALAVTGTTTTGGYAVPYIFDPTMIHIGQHTAVNPYRAACRVETITGGNNWRAVTATAITAKWDAEGAASVEGGPTIGQPSFTVQRADAFATVSIETLQDRPDITEELSKLFSEAKDNLEENSFTLGAGTTVYPQGMFLSGAFTAVTTATNDVTAIADIGLVEAALPLRHRANAAWFMSRSTQRQLEALDTTGYYFKRPGQYFAMGMGIPQNMPNGNNNTQLLGYPIWEVPSAVSTLTTDAAILAVFCDPKNYVVVDRLGLSVEVVQTMLNGATPSFPTGQRGIYCYWRATARVLNVDGGRQLKVQ